MINKLNQWAQGHPISAAAIGIATLIVMWVILTWLMSSSEYNLPKANELNKQSANAHVESIRSEANANTTAAQIDAIEIQRQESLRRYQESRKSASEAKNTLNKRKAEYDKLRKKSVVVSPDNLDARERQLQSDLTKLYKD